MNKNLLIIENEIRNFGECTTQTSLDIISVAVRRMGEELDRYKRKEEEQNARQKHQQRP